MSSFALLLSAAFSGLDALPVQVEIDTVPAEKPGLVIVGLPDSAVRESKDRVQSAIRHSGFTIPSVYATVNLAPGDLKKEGPLYDLPIALGVVKALGLLNTKKNLNDYLIIGELGLGGEIRPCKGALALALLAKKLGKKGIVLPEKSALEAAYVDGVDIIAVKTLREAVHFFEEKANCLLPSSNQTFIAENIAAAFDFSEIKGQQGAKRALEIAAAGAHNVLLSGPPGSGKTMLAKALRGILPPMSLDEALEASKIHSLAGILPENQTILTSRPFRAPHHTISYAGLAGGGSQPRPGEISLAHLGVLFLDELPEFAKSVLEVLRQPLEDRQVTISRACGNVTYPTNFICIAAMNPCPCGYLGDQQKTCRDTPAQIDRYRGKISGPLLDRFDIRLEVPSLSYSEMRKEKEGESSKLVLQRVVNARKIQSDRLKNGRTNSTMRPEELKRFCFLNDECQEILQQAVDKMGMSKRGCDRLIKVSRTIADLSGQENITAEHLFEALGFRTL